jgi:hypothetical protein
VDAHSKLGREFAIIRGRRDLLVDDNDGAVRWGTKGEIELVLSWASYTELVISYPNNARVIRQENKDGEVTISYVATR